MKDQTNKGSGLGVILFGITFLLILLFTAINIANSKFIESGYNALRDAVQSASIGSVIHIMTSENEEKTAAQESVINYGGEENKYDLYLQLALGYLINRNNENEGETAVVQTGEINNFLKLNHQRVMDTTMALLDDVTRKSQDISSESYKIMMFFIEPYRDASNRKFFHIIAYGNRGYNGSVTNHITTVPIGIEDSYKNEEEIYNKIQKVINGIVNCDNGYVTDIDRLFYKTDSDISINLNATGDVEGFIRDMDTYPYYLIVVKDFALPTLFNQDTYEIDESGNILRTVFESLSGDGRLNTPMCALNTGKIQRQTEDKGWGKDLKNK